MFSSPFSEGDVHFAPQNIESRPPNQRIPMVESFNVVNSILNYIYTNRITFSTVFQENDGTPNTCDTEDIYELAHRLDLEDLNQKALNFLKKTCNCKNITERVFSKFSSLYEEVDNVYSEFFQEHWLEVPKTSEFAQYFENLEVIRRIFRKFRGFMTAADFN